MVQLEEVEDETFQTQVENEGDWDTDSESDVSEAEDSLDETIYERIAALKDVIPPAQRKQLAETVSTTKDWSWWGFSGLANVTWLVGVSAMLVLVPFAVAVGEEQMLQMEEQQATMQQSSSDSMLASPDQSSAQGGAKKENL